MGSLVKRPGDEPPSKTENFKTSAVPNITGKENDTHPSHTSVSQVGGLHFQPFMVITGLLNSHAGTMREGQGGIWGPGMRHALPPTAPAPQSEKSPCGSLVF